MLYCPTAGRQERGTSMVQTPFIPVPVPQFVPRLLLLFLFSNYSASAAEPPELPASGAVVHRGWEFIYHWFYQDAIIIFVSTSVAINRLSTRELANYSHPSVSSLISLDLPGDLPIAPDAALHQHLEPMLGDRAVIPPAVCATRWQTRTQPQTASPPLPAPHFLPPQDPSLTLDGGIFMKLQPEDQQLLDTAQKLLGKAR